MSKPLTQSAMQANNGVEETPSKVEATTTMLDEPVPLSFPAVLRNSKLGDRFAHLKEGLSQRGPQITSKSKRIRTEQEGKRWVRRRDNGELRHIRAVITLIEQLTLIEARFVANPHIVPPTSGDYAIEAPQGRTTFPEPLPAYLPRVSPAPSPNVPVYDPGSAAAGRFSLSLKGVRKNLRKSGGRSRELIKVIEDEVVKWLKQSVNVMPVEESIVEERRVIDAPGLITEVRRSYSQLVWSVPDDAFLRWIVHCTARFHSVVSFSKAPAHLHVVSSC